MDARDLPPRLAADLAALSEGTCPEHGTPLRVTGWCVACQCWWRAVFPRQVVISEYPALGSRRPPEL
jgi:hypothetical protein